MQAAPDAACMLGSSRSCNNYKVVLELVGARPERPPIYVADASSQYDPIKEYQFILSSIVVLRLQLVSRSGMEDKQQQPQLDE